jgi:hypothetical protein
MTNAEFKQYVALMEESDSKMSNESRQATILLLIASLLHDIQKSIDALKKPEDKNAPNN